MTYVVRFNYKRFQRDLGYLVADLPALLKKIYGEDISKAAVYAWFARGKMPVDRLCQLLTIARIETQDKIDVWQYIENSDRSSRKRAA